MSLFRRFPEMADYIDGVNDSDSEYELSDNESDSLSLKLSRQKVIIICLF